MKRLPGNCTKRRNYDKSEKVKRMKKFKKKNNNGRILENKVMKIDFRYKM